MSVSRGLLGFLPLYKDLWFTVKKLVLILVAAGILFNLGKHFKWVAGILAETIGTEGTLETKVPVAKNSDFSVLSHGVAAACSPMRQHGVKDRNISVAVERRHKTREHAHESRETLGIFAQMSCLVRVVLCIAMVSSSCIVEGASPRQVKKDILVQETSLIAAVNQVRRQKGLEALKSWDLLSQYARQHSRDMADRTVDFGHAGFEARANRIQKAATCHSVGENVAYCYLIDDPMKKSIQMWMDSPHHRDNILGDYKETGIGIAYDDEGRCYITQLFSKRRQRLLP